MLILFALASAAILSHFSSFRPWILSAKMLSCAVCGLVGAGEARGEEALLAFRWVWVVFCRFEVCGEVLLVVESAGALELLVVGGGGEAGDFPESIVGWSACVAPNAGATRGGEALEGQFQAPLARFNAVNTVITRGVRW